MLLSECVLEHVVMILQTIPGASCLDGCMPIRKNGTYVFLLEDLLTPPTRNLLKLEESQADVMKAERR